MSSYVCNLCTPARHITKAELDVRLAPGAPPDQEYEGIITHVHRWQHVPDTLPTGMAPAQFVVKPGARLRIRTRRSAEESRMRIKGQDVQVFLVNEDGTEVPLSTLLSFQAVRYEAAGRAGYATCTLVCHDVSIDVEGELAVDEGRQLELAHWRERALKAEHDVEGYRAGFEP